MNYTDLHKELRSLFDPDESEIEMPGGLKVRNIDFISELPGNELINPTDSSIKENLEFRYPVFCPSRESNRTILMLHGLNERSWTKYLVWAHRLCELTNSYVILFPLSFHINRSPGAWGDPRSMLSLLSSRNKTAGKVSDSSFANVALSKRLTDDPMRFFYSGYQTGKDITRLIGTIRDGKHSVIPGKAKINIFAYSIGAFLSEILLLGDPDNLLSDSKLFIFCGGSVFSKMYGSSKFIMDKRAYDRVYNFFMKDFEGKAIEKSPMKDLVFSSRIGTAFRAMIDFDRLLHLRNSLVTQIQSRIKIISLKKDLVFPASGVMETSKILRISDNVSITDFQHPYAHENPFPLLDGCQGIEVNRSFDRIFMSAASFIG